MKGLLIVNPRSGRTSPDTESLVAEARRLGIETHLLRPGDDPARVARRSSAEVLGVAGGDGSLFLNNVSLGVYAQLVHRRERHRRRREALARVRAWATLLGRYGYSYPTAAASTAG